MLAKLHDDIFSDPDWVYEIKWDGYRAVAEVKGDKTRLYSRNGLSFQYEYPVIYDALAKMKADVVLDGEVVALNEHGMPSFQNLQQSRLNEDVVLIYYVFDILYRDGKSLRNLPLLERKAILKQLPFNDVIKYCDHVQGEGEAFFEAAKRQGLEGIIAKRADSTYKEGARSSNWLKIKHMLTDEAVIAGYTEPRGGRKFFGALILGTYEKGKLVYIGHTGTGFDNKTLKELYGKLQPLVTEANPFGEKVRVNMPVTWVKPQLVCNIKFTEITEGGNRRHPVFMGLRTDKAAKDVHQEAPVEVEDNAVSNTRDMKNTTALNKKELTNLDKIYWPDEGYTKGDMLEYYNEVSKYILPHIKGRPQSLLRTPNGIKGKSFFHKDAGENAPDYVDTYPVWSDSSNKTVDYLVINNKRSLLYVANLGCIEINPWNSTVDNPDNPDYLVMDLDPSDKNTFSEVVDCALVIKEIFERGGVKSYCKTSGASGLHVYVPLGGKYDYEHVRQFAELIAHLTVEQLPGSTTIERSLSKRAKNKIYVDYLQNKKGATLSCAYSLRPKPGAPVSTPLEWKEVKHSLDPVDFNIKNALKRLQKKGDLFAPVLKRGIDMEKVLHKLSGS